jgi:hypothetical protein
VNGRAGGSTSAGDGACERNRMHQDGMEHREEPPTARAREEHLVRHRDGERELGLSTSVGSIRL